MKFNRTDIMEAYWVMEVEWNNGGWLRERKSNQRRSESTDIQLDRMKFKVRHDLGFSALSQNGKEIVRNLCTRYGFEVPAEYTADTAMLDDFTQAYITCALWTSDEDPKSGEFMEHGQYVTENLAPETLARIKADCERFQKENQSLLAEYPGTVSQAGHDFWLTRNHHGAGFWDRGYGKVGDDLTEAAHRFGECDLYVGDDGKLYL